jgi:hypothetical protein
VEFTVHADRTPKIMRAAESGPVPTPSHRFETLFAFVGYSTAMPHLLNEPISADTTPAGVPVALRWRGDRMPVRSVLAVWQAPGEGRLYRVGVTAPDGEPGIAEIATGTDGWRIRHLWL